MDNNACCLSKTLKLIDILQKKAEHRDCNDNTCSRPFLGNLDNIMCFNTRPITFYGCDNNLISIDYDVVIDGVTYTGQSSVFRVEKVSDNCCLISILIDNPTPSDNSPYINTRESATVNLNCVCAIKCLNDVIVNL